MSRLRHLALAGLVVALGAVSVAVAQVPATLPVAPDPRTLLENTTRDLAATHGELDRLRAEHRQLEDEARGLGPRREALRARARREARWLYHLAQGDALAARGGPEVLLDQAVRAGRVRRVLRGTLRELATVRQRGDAIASERARVGGLLQAAEASVTRLTATQQALRGSQGGLLPPNDPGQRVTVYGGAAGASAEPTFAGSAGRLLFPLAGRAEVQRAWREGADGPGVEVLAPLGAPVRATYPGRVAFADRYGAYGRIVIVDHGEHYYTVSANLGRIDVRVGQEVVAGTVLGAVGNDDGRGSRLYFEVRHGGDTLDPAPWLGM